MSDAAPSAELPFFRAHYKEILEKRYIDECAYGGQCSSWKTP